MHPLDPAAQQRAGGVRCAAWRRCRAPPSAGGRPRWPARCRTPSPPTRRRATARRPRSEASSQLISLSTSALACTRARLSCTHSESISRLPWTSLVFCAHSRTPLSAEKIGCAETSATRSWLSWLVTSFQPPFSSPTRLADRHPDVLVVGGAGVDARHRVHRRPREALGGGRHDEHRDAAVLLGLGVGAHRQPHVVGVGDQAGPHLLAVDDVVVAVAHRGGAQRRPGRCPRPARSSRWRSAVHPRRSWAGRTSSARRCRTP